MNHKNMLASVVFSVAVITASSALAATALSTKDGGVVGSTGGTVAVGEGSLAPAKPAKLAKPIVETKKKKAAKKAAPKAEAEPKADAKEPAKKKAAKKEVKTETKTETTTETTTEGHSPTYFQPSGGTTY